MKENSGAVNQFVFHSKLHSNYVKYVKHILNTLFKIIPSVVLNTLHHSSDPVVIQTALCLLSCFLQLNLLPASIPLPIAALYKSCLTEWESYTILSQNNSSTILVVVRNNQRTSVYCTPWTDPSGCVHALFLVPTFTNTFLY